MRKECEVMKIGILTMYYGNISHGGLLQAFALQKTLEEFGYDAQVISYDYNYHKRSWLRTMAHEIKRIPYYTLCFRYGDHTDKKYREYMTMVPHSKYYTPDTISEIENEYDVIIVGSDQVWNETYCDEAFYLSFARDEIKKVAYAASVGKDFLSETQIKDLVAKISSFSAISVREKNLQEELNRSMRKPAAYVCDPTMLHDRSFWASHSNEKIVKGDYILLYILSPNERIIEHTNRFANKARLPLVTVPNVNCNMKNNETTTGDIQAWSVGPKEFLRLIMDAECVITDSFHCTVFSLIFNKEFFCFNRENCGEAMNSRLKSLLKYCGVDNRLIASDRLLESDKFQIIDYSLVNKQIEEFAKESREWLKESLRNNQ